jgi:hypothetical protein
MQRLDGMATRAETFRAQQQKHPSKRRAKPGPKNAHGAHDARGRKSAPNRRAGRKATYALERRTANARPSRKSTRKSANRSKPDTNFELRRERKTNSPEARHRRRSS